MIARIFLILLSLFGAGSVSAQCTGQDLRALMTANEATDMARQVHKIPFAQGNHWRAQKGGKTLHLIGTIHIHDPRLEQIIDRLHPVITSADLIFLEATPVEEKALQAAITAQPELVFLTSGPTLPELMSGDDWQRLSKAASARGIPPFMASKMQPWYLALLMGIPGCAMAEVASGLRGLDHMISGLATKSGIPMQPLEPFDTLFGLFNADPIEKQIEMLNVSIMPEQISEDAFFTLKEGYFEENAAEVWEFSRHLAHRNIALPADEIEVLFAQLQDLLLVQRNIAWLKRIENATEHNIVVAVGAAHLPGEFGLLQLLQDAGYILERQAF